MSQRMFSVVVMLVLFVVVLPANAQEVSTDPVMQDASYLAKDLGINVEEAARRLRLQDDIGILNERLVKEESRVFAGIWIQHKPSYQVVVLLTQGGYDKIAKYVDQLSLTSVIDVRNVSFTYGQLEADQSLAMNLVAGLGVRVESGVNIQNNQVELYVIDRERLDALISSSNIKMPPSVKIVKVENLSTLEVDIYDGLRTDGPLENGFRALCTSGFAVKNTNNENGILTAAHCATEHSNRMFYQGTELVFGGARTSGAYHVAWFKTPSFTARNLARDSTGNRSITSVKLRDQQAMNYYVCKYGVSTSFTCGFIVDKSYSFQGSNTYIKIHNDGVNLSEGGDSGAGWYSSAVAYGIHVGGLGDDAFYMAINYAGTLGVTVLTN